MAFRPRQIPADGPHAGRVSRAIAVVEAVLERERAQLPLWSPVALGIGIFAWFALPARADWMAFLCLCGAGAVPMLFMGRGAGRLAWAGGIGLLLMAAGCVLPWGKAMLVGGTVLARPATVRMEAAILSVEPMSGRGTVRLLVRPVARADLPARVRINLAMADLPGGALPRIGDRLSFRARLMPPAAPSLPGGYDYARRAWFDGVGATGRALPPVTVTQRAPGSGAGFRAWLSGHVAGQVAGAPGALAVTMATGDRGRIPPQVEDAMRASGLSHLLSISGVHVTALIGGVVFLLYRLLALSPGLALRWPLMLVAAAGGAAAGIGYTLLTGAEVPTLRSCITALLVMAGLALGREAISLRLLACGALILMLFWPEAVIGPSFQLSFAAVATILALYEHPRVRAAFEAREEPGWARLLRFLGGVFATGVAVEMVLMPIALYHFHKSGLMGSLANMIAIPLTEFVVMPAEALALVLDLVGLGAPAWWVVGQALGLLIAIADFVAAHTMMALAPAIPPTAFALTMGGLFWMMLWRTAWRWAGLAAAAVGMAGYVLAPVPDILVSSDGHHVALRTEDGGMALLRYRTGDYMRGQMAEQAAFDGVAGALSDWPAARCSEDFCTADVERGGRRHRILIARTRLRVPWASLVRACAGAEIVIADRYLPDSCRPRWLKIDRVDLARSGGAAIILASSTVRRSRNPRDQHPWVMAIPSGRTARPASSLTERSRPRPPHPSRSPDVP